MRRSIALGFVGLVTALAATVAPVEAGPAGKSAPPPATKAAARPATKADTITLVVKRDAGETVILHIDGVRRTTVRLVPLAVTPPPRCQRDRTGALRCRITY
jgi:hypothetical protein